jgi:hypothetical protein
MKKIILILGLMTFGLFIFESCNKEVVDQFENLQPLTPTSLDTGGGNWKLFVLTNNEQISVAAPASPTSAAYLTELSNVKSALKNQSKSQKSAVKYWSAGSVMRWHEIMRTLVAKHNVAPIENPDGTYPIPSADNPFNYPQFPFANPPYAARAYAYTSVAIYDALVAATHFKMKYNRLAPYHYDATIEPLVPRTDLPSFPCEDAVVAAAARTILLKMFPSDAVFIQEKYLEAVNFKKWAGAATQSDLDAGVALGGSVADAIFNRAKTDGMANSVGNQHIWDSLATHVTQNGQISWKSLESPARPPMLPLYGKVKPWLIPADQLLPTNITFFQPAPPATNSAEFAAQLAETKKQADPNDREKMRIVHFWADGVATCTPPGHWNIIATDYIYEAKMSEIRAARTFSLLNIALMDAAIECWATKYIYMFPRPTQMDPSIKTLTGLPNFPAYTSGHSTFSAAAATILGHIFPEASTNFENMAKEASISRVYGGIHYPMDCDFGLIAGRKVGEFAVERAKIDGAE